VGCWEAKGTKRVKGGVCQPEYCWYRTDWTLWSKLWQTIVNAIAESNSLTAPLNVPRAAP